MAIVMMMMMIMLMLMMFDRTSDWCFCCGQLSDLVLRHGGLQLAAAGRRRRRRHLVDGAADEGRTGGRRTGHHCHGLAVRQQRSAHVRKGVRESGLRYVVVVMGEYGGGGDGAIAVGDNGG